MILRWEDQLAVLCAKAAGKVLMRTVQQNVLFIVNSASHNCKNTSWAYTKAFYSCYDAFFGPGSCDKKGDSIKVQD